MTTPSCPCPHLLTGLWAGARSVTATSERQHLGCGGCHSDPTGAGQGRLMWRRRNEGRMVFFYLLYHANILLLIRSEHSDPVNPSQCKQWAASICQHESYSELINKAFTVSHSSVQVHWNIYQSRFWQIPQPRPQQTIITFTPDDVKSLTTKKPGLKAQVWGSLLDAFAHSVSLMPKTIIRSAVFRPTGITCHACDISHLSKIEEYNHQNAF